MWSLGCPAQCRQSGDRKSWCDPRLPSVLFCHCIRPSQPSSFYPCSIRVSSVASYSLVLLSVFHPCFIRGSLCICSVTIIPPLNAWPSRINSTSAQFTLSLRQSPVIPICGLGRIFPRRLVYSGRWARRPWSRPFRGARTWEPTRRYRVNRHAACCRTAAAAHCWRNNC